MGQNGFGGLGTNLCILELFSMALCEVEEERKFETERKGLTCFQSVIK